MSKICLCLNAKTLAQNLALIEKYRSYIDIAELRADCLFNEEHEFVRRFPELAGIPIILTVRRKIDGGFFERGEAARIVLLSKALAFAQADMRKNFAYVDLEEDLDTPSLEEVARAFGTRIIRSFHNFKETDAALENRVNALFRVGDEIAKAALMPQSLDDVRRIIRVAKSIKNHDAIILGMGDMGQCTRILAPRFGGYLSYTSPGTDDRTSGAAPGQLNPVELCNVYRFREMNVNTQIYGITGYPLTTTASPEFHNKVYMREKLNAVYLRFPAATIGEFMRLADELELSGASITVPHKESVIDYLSSVSEAARYVGACNTIIRMPRGWHGCNTDAPGFSDSLLNLIKRKNLKGRKALIIGAGGAARAVAAELCRLGAKALVLNRNILRAKRLADRFNFEYGSLEAETEVRVKKFADIIVQTTSLGMAPDINDDPFPQYSFTGNEVVIDIIYKPEITIFLSRALAAGCTAINGYDMLQRQAEYQFCRFFDCEFPKEVRVKE
ncbi:MAG: type I 3-dehydroquinate dehydratase [Spirochaetaceae bacterium]|jgi:3-dehydroquinate dehydratase/shikimate dehydrogenase|nr:type I 3-dehydroquinate dehydratase [Spirochaetaceae bacterium]